MRPIFLQKMADLNALFDGFSSSVLHLNDKSRVATCWLTLTTRDIPTHSSGRAESTCQLFEPRGVFFFGGTLLTLKSCSTEGRKLEKCKTTLFFFFFFVDVFTVGSLNKLVNFRDHLSLPKRARRRPNLTRLPRQKYFEDYSTFFLKKNGARAETTGQSKSFCQSSATGQ